MLYMIAGLALFFGAHLFATFRPRTPDTDIRRKMGYGPYMGLFSLAAIGGVALIAFGYDAMRPAYVVWTPPVWLKHLNILIQLFAFMILFAAYTPTGRIKKTLKHPMLVGVKLWSAGHLLANGELNSIILFGSFLAYAVIDRIALKKRGDTGPSPVEEPSLAGDVLAILIGIGVWLGLLLWLHPVLFGVAAMP